LEDRMAPANVLMWTGADANINLTVPGLMSNYYKGTEVTQNFIPASVSNVQWIGNETPLTPTGFTSGQIPIGGAINFPSIGTNGVNQGATTRGATVDLTPGMHLVEVEYGQAGGGASMTAQWDAQGGTTFVDFPDGVNFFYNSSTTGNVN